MMKIDSIKKTLSNSRILSCSEMSHTKGGSNSLTKTVAKIIDASIELIESYSNGNETVEDDKRRSRPGGGVSTL